MKTISDSDWLIVLATLQKQRDITLSRSERERIIGVIARVEGGQPPAPEANPDVFAVFNSWQRPGP
jgi:hypothetical protein